MSVFSFVREMWPVILLYGVGDVLTTVWAMQMGAPELNPVLATGIDLYGYGVLLAVKFAVMAAVALVYHSCESAAIKKGAVDGFTALGFVLCCNNLAVIGGAL